MLIPWLQEIGIVLQFVAAILVLRLIWITGKVPAWIMLAIAFILMAVRRAVAILWFARGWPELAGQTIDLVLLYLVSIFLIVGVYMLRPLFESIKRNEEELRRSHEELEQRVEERTHELNQAYEALGASEYKYRTLVENLPQRIFWKDRESVYVSVNSNLAADLVIAPQDIIGKTDYDFFPKELADKYRADDAAVMESGETRDIEEKYIRDGQELIVHTVKTPLRDEGGKVIGILGIFWDITAQKSAQEEIIRLNEYLQRRTAELEAVNRELEAFSYSVSHDLRAPLRSIDGFSLALLDDYSGKLDDQGRDYLNRVRSASQRMGQLIDDLLKLSRVTRSEIHYEQVNLSSFVQEAAARLRESDPSRNVDFIIEPNVQAVGDPHLLRIVVENLLSNAWKFTNTRRTAKIEFGTKEQDHETVYFMSDNGVGFDPAYADKLFIPFQRLHGVKEFPGTGIGLAIVHRIVIRHGGAIWGEGEEGQGATFYFTLPGGQE